MKKLDDLGVCGKAWRICWTAPLFLILMAVVVGLVVFAVSFRALGATPVEQRQVESASEDIQETDPFSKEYQEAFVRQYRDEINYYVFEPCYRKQITREYADKSAHLNETAVEFERSLKVMMEVSLDYYMTIVMRDAGDLFYKSNFDQRRGIYVDLFLECINS